MPPKETVRRALPTIVRLPVSTSSLVYVPEDAVAGFEERLETGVEWTLEELTLRRHKSKAQHREEIPSVTFSEAIENKIKKSLLNGFLENSNMSLEEQYDLLLTTEVWDNEKFANDEGKLCFKNTNNFTEDVFKLVKKAVRIGDRQVLRDLLKTAEVLRVNHARMTDLDSGIQNYHRLVSLVLCCNYLKDLDGSLLPSTLRSLELQANHISDIKSFVDFLPAGLIYLGLGNNLLTSDSLVELSRLPANITVLDLSDNDIYNLEPVVRSLVKLPSLNALYLVGNPCSVSYGYARFTLMNLPKLKWLDGRKVIDMDRTREPHEFHPDDLRCTYFNFSVIRVISAPQPPKPEKGNTAAFHIELDIPLLDVTRRRFLMYRNNSSLIEILPPPEDYEPTSEPEPELELEPSFTAPMSKLAMSKAAMSKSALSKGAMSKAEMSKIEINKAEISKAVLSKALMSKHSIDSYETEELSSESGIFCHLVPKDSHVIKNYTTFESNKVQWAKIMTFQEPAVKIFCPDLTALRNTFRSCITVRLVYTVFPPKVAPKKSAPMMKPPPEESVTIATVKCYLKNPDWSQPSQHFHWDETLATNDAMHWGEGDLSVLQYGLPAGTNKAQKGKSESLQAANARALIPESMTCHFGFGVDSLRFH